MKDFKLDSALGKIITGSTPAIITMAALKFEDELSTQQAVELIQERLYEDIGAAGCFRLAPLNYQDMTMDFVEIAHTKAKGVEFLPVTDNTIHFVFASRDDCGEGLDNELQILSEELSQFSKNENVEIEQVNMHNFY